MFKHKYTNNTELKHSCSQNAFQINKQPFIPKSNIEFIYTRFRLSTIKYTLKIDRILD